MSGEATGQDVADPIETCLRTPCILHTGKLNSSGYGSKFFRVPGVGQTTLAHRGAWMLANGAIPKGLTIDHLCQVKTCINVEHMELVSQYENTRRSGAYEIAAARKRAITHCPKGHEYTSENTRFYEGKRHCNACRLDRSRAWSAGQVGVPWVCPRCGKELMAASKRRHNIRYHEGSN